MQCDVSLKCKRGFGYWVTAKAHDIRSRLSNQYPKANGKSPENLYEEPKDQWAEAVDMAELSIDLIKLRTDPNPRRAGA